MSQYNMKEIAALPSAMSRSLSKTRVLGMLIPKERGEKGQSKKWEFGLRTNHLPKPSPKWEACFKRSLCHRDTHWPLSRGTGSQAPKPSQDTSPDYRGPGSGSRFSSGSGRLVRMLCITEFQSHSFFVKCVILRRLLKTTL